MFLKLFLIFITILATTVLQSCAQVNVKKMTYKALRQADCRINEPNSFCERSFAHEYHEYERLRLQFLNDKEAAAYRTGQNQTEFTVRASQL